MAEKKQPQQGQQKSGGKKRQKPAQKRYTSEHRWDKNKKARAARHGRWLERKQNRREDHPGYILPSKRKRAAKRRDKMAYRRIVAEAASKVGA